ncbi:hypothetical protein E4P42_25620 [Mycobacterium sp. PS03-16]|uniref:hypothetical protein n=1 Tax=Mycobacterium sp. PS03-16 TaxID=2559611 RepID=UPI00107313F8|nr:hypothetical protein [Mycobacterium sp. PS03-16]TFV54575.1 hypothetical protein E4P42_25620 [Mycobacterium sp. PS03-16]
MSARKRFTSAAAVAAVLAAPAATVTVGAAFAPTAAAQARETFLPFSPVLRRCDFSTRQYYDSSGDGRATATVRSTGGQVSADVQMAVAEPNATYEVRLIQMPRESEAGCHAGAPGTAVATLRTDGIGGGAVSLSGPRMSGATGAWVTIERAQPFSQLPAEFYSTDYVANV